MKKKIDINCDLGESYGRFKIGRDAEILPMISSCNIACGFHGGDPLTIDETIDIALMHNVRIGAHPGFPDLPGFGRREMNIAPDELKALVRYQVGALKSMVESKGGALAYVKPHGALYNMAFHNEFMAAVIIDAVRSFGPDLAVMGMPGSELQRIAGQSDIEFIIEAFADRRYNMAGGLVPRSVTGSVLEDVDDVVEQVLSIARDQTVMTMQNVVIPMHAQSICIHGDGRNAFQVVQLINDALKRAEISISGDA